MSRVIILDFYKLTNRPKIKYMSFALDHGNLRKTLEGRLTKIPHFDQNSLHPEIILGFYDFIRRRELRKQNRRWSNCFYLCFPPGSRAKPNG